MSLSYKMPSTIKRKILRNATIVTSSENSGRRFGDFSEFDIDSRAYKNTLFYIQKGLSSHSELINGILKSILKIQYNASIRYNLIPFTFGNDDEPFYKGKYFDINYQPSIIKIAKVLLELSGDKKSQNPAIIPRLFPKSTIANSYSGGKTGIKKKEDLLIVIGKKREIFFDEAIKGEVQKFRKQILFVEIENENVKWYFGDYEPEYRKIMKQGVNKMQRRFENKIQNELLKNALWDKQIKDDCKKQKVFFTIRDNRVDLYHKGGKLFGFEKNEFKTHIKYAAVIEKDKKDYISELDLSNPKYLLATDFGKDYKRIKENCANYSGVEASGVSRLYHKYSYLSNSNIVVLDIEVSFQSQSNNKKQDRIDILLYNKISKTLQFVEAKHYSNKEIRSFSKADVIGQIKRYNKQITSNKKNIISEYGNYIEIINNIFDKKLPKPEIVCDEVTLLIFGFDNDQKNGNLKKIINPKLQADNIRFYEKGDIKTINIEPLWQI